MTRAWRIEYEGAYYHVLSRGNEQQNIFQDDEDRKLFLELVGEMSERFNVEIHAYVLMSNHYHFLLRTRKPNLSKSMQWFGATYTRRYNIRHVRTGHLFQGRFKSILVENESYLMQLSCYIHRNPLRAGMVKRIADHKWSSYLAYSYGKKSEKWLKTNLILGQFNGDIKKKRMNYREKVQRYSNEEKKIWEDFKCGLFFGSESYVMKMKEKYLPGDHHSEKPQQKALKRSINVYEKLEVAASLLGANLSAYQGKKRPKGEEKIQRDLLMNALWETGLYKNQEIGNIFGLSYSAVSKSVKNIRQMISRDKSLKKQYEIINSQFKM